MFGSLWLNKWWRRTRNREYKFGFIRSWWKYYSFFLTEKFNEKKLFKKKKVWYSRICLSIEQINLFPLKQQPSIWFKSLSQKKKKTEYYSTITSNVIHWTVLLIRRTMNKIRYIKIKFFGNEWKWMIHYGGCCHCKYHRVKQSSYSDSFSNCSFICFLRLFHLTYR